jgi:hypothetical protein
VQRRYFNDLLTAIDKTLAPPLAMEPGPKCLRPRLAHQQRGGLEMKKIVVLSALAVFALGAVVGRASVSVTPRAAPEVFSPTSVVPVNSNLPIESYTAI